MILTNSHINFNQIVYVPKLDQQDITDVERVAISAIKDVGKESNIPTLSYADYSLQRYQRIQNDLSADAVLFITLGGDGTMLAAMRDAASHVQGAVLGINFGKLGFLTSVDGNKLKAYSKFCALFHEVISDEWVTMDIRLIMEGHIPTPMGTTIDSVAANEFLITTPNRSNPLEYDVFVNDQQIASQSGDGIIISTPSGSTAYAMSAGGAIMGPNSRSIQIVPLAAHTLTSRPIIVSENDTISVRGKFSKRNNVISVVADGQAVINAESYNQKDLVVSMSKKSLINIWRPVGWNFFDTLSEKLGWQN